MTSDGVRTYSYDGENRLIKVTQGSSTWHYVYDYLGRRIEKRGTGITKTRFLYDGWNVIAELDGSNTIVRRFAWGLDVSGSLQGAGGIGGLLVIDAGAQYHPLYDASHNVIGLYNSSGSLQAAYAYDAFGNLQTSAGTYAASNPFRSATKYTDSETGFVYYGMRYYSPMLGRFINRDPIEEGGGLNLYLFCKNDGVNQSDYLGMNAFTDWTIAILNAIGSFFGNASSDVEVLDRMIVTPGEDDSNVSKPSDDSPGYLSMVASNRAVTDYQNENTMGESAPNSTGIAATAATAAYDMGKSAPAGYSVVQVYTIKADGTDAVLFRNNTTGALVLAYRGTQSLSDWGTNIYNALGGQSSRYSSAVNIAKDVKLQNPGVSITLVGHSLGGGQAALASAATGLNAITFNAAGVNPTNYGYTNASTSQITNYSIIGEPLTTVQLLTSLPNALGNQVYLAPNTFPTGGNVLNHGTGAVLPAVGGALPVPVP